MLPIVRLAALLLALCALPVLAAPPPNTATLSWTTATTRVDGTTIPGPVTFNVYRGVGAGGEATTPYATGVTGTTFADSTGLASGTTVCYQVTEIETATGLESARSNEACKTFPASPPSAPSTLTVN